MNCFFLILLLFFLSLLLNPFPTFNLLLAALSISPPPRLRQRFFSTPAPPKNQTRLCCECQLIFSMKMTKPTSLIFSYMFLLSIPHGQIKYLLISYGGAAAVYNNNNDNNINDKISKNINTNILNNSNNSNSNTFP